MSVDFTHEELEVVAQALERHTKYMLALNTLRPNDKHKTEVRLTVQAINKVHLGLKELT